MNKGLLIVIGLLLFGLLLSLSPTSILADQNVEKKQQADQPQKETKKIPSNPDKVKNQEKKPDDNSWKKQLEKRDVQLIEWLQKNYPGKAKELLNTHAKQAKKFTQQINRARQTYGPIQRAERSQPKLAKLLRENLKLINQRNQLLREIASAKDEDKPKLLSQLRELVSARFDNLIQQKQLQFEIAQKRLKRIQQQLEKLKVEKDESVEKRMKELTEKDEKVNWK